MKSITPAIWVRFTPYLVTWTVNKYGTGVSLSNCPVLELRSLRGIREALRKTVDEDLEMKEPPGASLSQLHYDVLCTGLGIRTQVAAFAQKDLQAYLPVHVPDFLLTENGVIRPFSRLMQLRRDVARAVASVVYDDFWHTVRRYDNDRSFAIDKDMLEEFCRENGLDDVYTDDLRNQYQRLKRNGYFADRI